MSIKKNLVYFGLRQVIGEGVDELADIVKSHFCDPSRTLPKALQSANEKAWQALELALVGDSLSGKFKTFFTSAQMKAITSQVDAVLDEKGKDFRKRCLQELKTAKKADF